MAAGDARPDIMNGPQFPLCLLFPAIAASRVAPSSNLSGKITSRISHLNMGYTKNSIYFDESDLSHVLYGQYRIQMCFSKLVL